VTYGAYGTDLVTHRQASTAATLEKAKSVYGPGTLARFEITVLAKS
jgi:hypothetical protein